MLNIKIRISKAINIKNNISKTIFLVNNKFICLK